MSEMKVAEKVLFLFRDTEGFASAILDALHPNPSSSFTRRDDIFDFSLEGYGIKNHKASGNVFHYVDDQGIYQVSVLVMQHYEPPVLACALNEVLNKIIGDGSSLLPTLLVPFLVASSKVKGQSKPLRSDESKPLVYGIQIGQNTDIMMAVQNKTQEPPSSLQIQHETLACFLHFVRIMKLPTFFLIGQTGQHSDNKSDKELETIHVIGEILATGTGLQFSEGKVKWNLKKATKERNEPWRALYG
ncbi:hypothetical protein Lal_00043318 [Lupinus albus]|uniref:DUF7894 domain-containing protein n=1 Tax=Lupinus albus TaxID=3870 RepID=A0A6A4PUU0_LUPAL|nr:hypothetical protein Lalb_Chr10g0094201 [Lupinus albus]KAF1889099.1 hypothetical protein Lal_00043318 [Lupinus albus]